jgi:hypothetical protein
VCKSAFTQENSLAYVNQINFNVTKYFLNYPPVSSTYNFYGYFVSSHSRKTIFRLDPDTFQQLDSLVIPTQAGSIGAVFKKGATSFYVIAGNKEIWQVDVSSTGELSAVLKIAESSGITVSAAAYDETRNEIYVADNNNGQTNGELHVFNSTDGLIKRSIQLGGRNPAAIAFRY